MMTAMLAAGVWGLLAAGSLLLGAVIAIFHTPHTRSLGLIMGFGSGVLLSAVSFELIDVALETAGTLKGTSLGFFAGALVFTGGDFLIRRVGYGHRKDIDGSPPDASCAW